MLLGCGRGEYMTKYLSTRFFTLTALLLAAMLVLAAYHLSSREAEA